MEYFRAIFLGDGDDGLIAARVGCRGRACWKRWAARFRLALFTGRPQQEARITLRRFAPALVFDPIIGGRGCARR